MKSKKKELAEAITLRKRGYSLNEIARTLQISKSTASLWLRHIPLPQHAMSVIQEKRDAGRSRAAAIRRSHTDERLSKALLQGQRLVTRISFSKDMTKLLCALLYWCEGTKLKRGRTIAFTNSDPELVQTFLQLLRSGFHIEESKLRFVVHLHDYHEEDAQLQFWSKMTNIPLTQCLKPYRKNHTGIRTRDGYQGCVSVRYHDVELGRQIEGIAKAFLNKRGP